MTIIADPFADSVLRNISKDILDSFNDTQLDALQTALAKVHDRSRNRLDVRFSIPLYWARYYVVFLLGRDLRSHVQEVLLNRRKRSGRAAQIGVISLMAWLILAGAAITLFIALYLLKSAMGIDIFPDKHLSDFLGL